MNDLKTNYDIFESIKHIDESGHEYWFARELMSLLEYSKWERFSHVIKVDMMLMTIFPGLGRWSK